MSIIINKFQAPIIIPLYFVNHIYDKPLQSPCHQPKRCQLQEKKSPERWSKIPRKSSEKPLKNVKNQLQMGHTAAYGSMGHVHARNKLERADNKWLFDPVFL